MMKNKKGKYVNRMIFLCMLLTPCFMFAEETPSLELLEFLGNWEINEDEWQDPLEFMQELDALEAEAQAVKVEDAQDGQ